ncbi:ABC transporter substrate-binding protein [Embleya hyalina]|uniref:ABC transporter periplasmic component n=1 Tax=Embleya hyalina TaxID=516124 RepID=A0A401YSU4_9ACTN|nr:iron-siderophore ABC transporter substrate-binding protein [Embleya hyalina]GCD97646.1 ABC transporter periplasmic component [Embleya hyalina]
MRFASLSRVAATLGVVAALVLTGCSSEGADGARGAGSGSADTREVRTAKGVVKVPVAPKRVVTLDMGELDTALTLGVKPVGSVVGSPGAGFPRYHGDKTAGIREVGAIGAPNLEVIESLKPDLILGNLVRDADRHDALSRIAPVVFSEQAGTRWRQNFLLDADALNKKAEGDRVVAAFTARAKAFGGALGDPGAVRVSVLRFVAGQNRLYGKATFIGDILSEIGLGRPTAQNVDTFMVEVSAERIEQADGDVIFVATYGPKDKTDHDKVTGGPLWKTLNAVKSGRAHEVDDEYWMVGTGYTAADHVLTDLERLLPKRG